MTTDVNAARLEELFDVHAYIPLHRNPLNDPEAIGLWLDACHSGVLMIEADLDADKDEDSWQELDAEVGGAWDDYIAWADDVNLTKVDSVRDYLFEAFFEAYALPDEVARYLDDEAIASDMRHDYTVSDDETWLYLD